jgi:hypothetical protein
MRWHATGAIDGVDVRGGQAFRFGVCVGSHDAKRLPVSTFSGFIWWLGLKAIGTASCIRMVSISKNKGHVGRLVVANSMFAAECASDLNNPLRQAFADVLHFFEFAGNS